MRCWRGQHVSGPSPRDWKSVTTKSARSSGGYLDKLNNKVLTRPACVWSLTPWLKECDPKQSFGTQTKNHITGPTHTALIPCDVWMKCNRTGPNPGLRAGGVETGYYPRARNRATTHGLVLKKNEKKIEKKVGSPVGGFIWKGDVPWKNAILGKEDILHCELVSTASKHFMLLQNNNMLLLIRSSIILFWSSTMLLRSSTLLQSNKH